jgi:AraC-like DNA-binding protein
MKLATMKEVNYAFVDLDSDDAFQLFGHSFGGVLKNKTLHFDNAAAKGELIKLTLDEGLWIRKWKLTVFQKVNLHKLPVPAGGEIKFNLLYFLNPSLFNLKKNLKKLPVNSHHNNMFLSNQVVMDFNVVPKQPFYVMDIAFTASWLLQQFADADPAFKTVLHQYVTRDAKTLLTEPCNAEEYQTLHELEVSIQAEREDVLFIRSRIYKLICSFFNKVFVRKEVGSIRCVVHYDQMVLAETMIMENLKAPPKIEAIARQVNMSVSSLLRQFKAMYGKSIHEYYVAQKMELAKRALLGEKITVKEIAERLGYNQASPFIDTFTKYHGFSPGSLKATSNQY